jgi:hypothetical protein
MNRGLFLAACVLVISGCSEDPIDVAPMESEIEKGYEDQTGDAIVVDCPDDAVWERGEEFRCVGETQNGSRRVLITVFMDTDTQWTWQAD